MGQLETQPQGIASTDGSQLAMQRVPQPQGGREIRTSSTVAEGTPRPVREVHRKSITDIRRGFENTELQAIADRILNYYNISQTAEGKERAIRAMEILEWMHKNLDQNSRKALKQFLEATFGDKQTKTENFQANSVVVGVLVYMFNDVNVLLRRQNELSQNNLYKEMSDNVKKFLNEFLPKIANNTQLARKIGIIVSEYDSQIGKIYSGAFSAMRNALPSGLQTDQTIQELLRGQQTYLRGELDVSFGQRLLYQAVTHLGLSSKYAEAIKNNNFSFFRRDYGDGSTIVQFDLMAATVTRTNQGPVGSNNTLLINYKNTRTYRAWVSLSSKLSEKFKDVFDETGKAKDEYKSVFDLLRKDLALRTGQSEESLKNLTDLQVLYRLAYLTMFYSKTDREFSHIPGMTSENSSSTAVESSATFEYFESQRNRFWVFNPNHTLDQQFRSVFGTGFAAQDLINRVELFVQTLRSNVDKVQKNLQTVMAQIEGRAIEISALIEQLPEANKERLQQNLEKFRVASIQIAMEMARTVLSAAFNGSLDERGNLTITHLRDRTLQEALDQKKLPIFLLNPNEGSSVINILSQNQEIIHQIVGNFYAQQGQSLPPLRTGSRAEQAQQTSTTRFVILESLARYADIEQPATQQFAPIQQATQDIEMQIEANKYYSYARFLEQGFVLAKDSNNNPLVGIPSQDTSNPSTLKIAFYRMEDVVRNENGQFVPKENARPVNVANIQIKEIGDRNNKQKVIYGEDVLNALKMQDGGSIKLFTQLGSNTLTLEFVGQQGQQRVEVPKGTVLFKGKDEYGEFTASLVEVVGQGQNMTLRLLKKYQDNREIGVEINAKELSFVHRENQRPFSYVSFSIEDLSRLGITEAVTNIQIARGQRFEGIIFAADQEVYAKGLSTTLTYQNGQQVQISITKKQDNTYEVKINDKSYTLAENELKAILNRAEGEVPGPRTWYYLDLSKLEEILKQKDQQFTLRLNEVKEYTLKYKDAETRQTVRNTAEETQIPVSPHQQQPITTQPPSTVQPPQVSRPRTSSRVSVTAPVQVQRPKTGVEVIPSLEFDVILMGPEEATEFRQTQARVLRDVIMRNSDRALSDLVGGNQETIRTLTALDIARQFVRDLNAELTKNGEPGKDLMLPDGGEVPLFVFDNEKNTYKINDAALEYLAKFLNTNKETLMNYEILASELEAAFPDKEKTFARLREIIERKRQIEKEYSVISKWEIKLAHPISRDGNFYGWGSVGQSVIRGWNAGIGIGAKGQVMRGVDASLEAGFVQNLSTKYGVPVVRANLDIRGVISVGYEMRGPHRTPIFGLGFGF